MKKILALVLALTLSLSLVPVFAQELPSLAGNYYSYQFSAEGYGNFQFFLHFYEEVPVLGSVFYMGLLNNQQKFAGTYTVEKLERPYSVYADRKAREDNAAPLTGTAPYTVNFFGFDGTLLDQCGWDGEGILYNDMTVMAVTGSGPMPYALDKEPDTSVFAEAYKAEVGVSYLEFVADEDETSTVQLFHSTAYADLVTMLVEGIWAMAARDDGGYDFALTPNDPMDTAAVLSVAADRATAKYTAADGSEVLMHNAVKAGPALKFAFEGKYTVAAYKADANLTLSLYDDNSCELLVSLFGNEAVLDSGTWSVTPGYTFTCTFIGAGAIDSVMDAATHAISLQYKGAMEGIGEIDAVLSLVVPGQ